MKAITARQLEVLKFIEAYSLIHEYPPSIRDIRDGFQMASTNTVTDHLAALERKGYIDRDERTARSIRIVVSSDGVKPAEPRTFRTEPVRTQPSRPARGLAYRKQESPILGALATGGGPLSRNFGMR